MLTKKAKTLEAIVYMVLLFFTGCFVGWLWEIITYMSFHGDWNVVNLILHLRGVLHGPWVPLYGFGCVMLVAIRDAVHKKILPCFVCGTLACGLMEYGTSYVLETAFGAKWWDYSAKFLNLHGRVYAGGLLFFGLAGVLVAFLVEPALHKCLRKVPQNLKTIAFVILVVLFLADVIFSVKSPNIGLGVQVAG